ncbi:hypothetical protein MHEL_50530 [Mycolicibacterium helvum]|uniref:Uncharacterized protein n=1 Tax=Mycolicibacterium helvum TaxID=1534349 RepID=A0A7I7TCQ0_9MYCO|nr:hypothetical protein MHEL_50530 [Mycolicibacterium helvum]
MTETIVVPFVSVKLSFPVWRVLWVAELSQRSRYGPQQGVGICDYAAGLRRYCSTAALIGKALLIFSGVPSLVLPLEALPTSVPVLTVFATRGGGFRDPNEVSGTDPSCRRVPPSP